MQAAWFIVSGWVLAGLTSGGAEALAGAGPGASTNLSAKPVGYGELELTGRNIERLELRAQGSHPPVILQSPGQKVKVPAGTYVFETFLLQEGGIKMSGSLARQLKVTEGGTARLVAGAPLTNYLTVERRGDVLELSQNTVGCGGEVYAPVDRQEKTRPGFTVLKHGKRVGSGKFDFG